MRPPTRLSMPSPTSGLIGNLPPQDVPPTGLLGGSNMFVDLDGFAKPRFGYSPLANLTNVLVGSVEISGAAVTGTVNLAIPQATATYPIVYSVRPGVGAPAFATAVITTQTKNGFVFTLGAAPGVGNSIVVEWYVPNPTGVVAGVLTISGATATGTVTFAIPEVDASYGVLLGVAPQGAAPFVSANYLNRTFNGFDVNLSAAPGVGNSVVVYWLRVRTTDALAGQAIGTLVISGATLTGTVVFGAAQADTSYDVAIGIRPDSGAPPFVNADITAKTVNGFTVNLSAQPGVGNGIAVDFFAGHPIVAQLSEPVMGGIIFRDKATTLRYVVATPTRWYQLDSSIPGWVDISDPANLNTGTIDDHVQFIAFAQGGDIWAIGVNNKDPMRRWRPADATYQTIAAAPIARDITSVLGRVFVGNTVEAGTRFSYRTRWSSVNDATTWPALANNDLVDDAKALTSVKRLNRSTVAVYGETGITLAIAQQGTDATAFRFEEIAAPDAPGPCSPACVTSFGGSHYYLATDARHYVFDGVMPTPISIAVDPIVGADILLSFSSRFHSVYFPPLRQIWTWYVGANQTQPQRATVYRVDEGRFEPLQTFPVEPVTASFMGFEALGVNWTTWVSPSDTWLTIPYPSWSAIPNSLQLVMALGMNSGKIERFGFASTDDSNAIDYSLLSYLLRIDPIVQILANHVDYLFRRSQVSESVTLTISTLAHPTAVPVPVFTKAVAVADDSDGFTTELPPSVLREDVYLQFALQGSSVARAVAFGGADLFVYPEGRP